ncbi:alpha/beta family hydrolase [Butyrivibrio sp. AE3004]|uniref:alpha/beta family hydrolase n=1 Tax=Butyrivibrio sp. AE3004 TaxID=1506994 RepID=UPI0004949740|nr:alpha/beta family hydrolase [Butyrivibrio sp. AE3004]
MSKKIAVLFPGIGYHCDKPLLYYSRKLAKQYDYRIKEIQYDFDGEILDVKNNKARMMEAIEEFTLQAKDQLSEISFEKYDNIVFVGKSIGTAIAARLASKKDLPVRQVVLTPVEDTLKNLPKEDVVVFHGLSDPWCENDIVEDAQKKIGFELHLIEDANHSLETGNALKDINILKEVIRRVDEYLSYSKITS